MITKNEDLQQVDRGADGPGCDSTGVVHRGTTGHRDRNACNADSEDDGGDRMTDEEKWEIIKENIENAGCGRMTDYEKMDFIRGYCDSRAECKANKLDNVDCPAFDVKAVGCPGAIPRGLLDSVVDGINDILKEENRRKQMQMEMEKQREAEIEQQAAFYNSLDGLLKTIVDNIPRIRAMFDDSEVISFLKVYYFYCVTEGMSSRAETTLEILKRFRKGEL